MKTKKLLLVLLTCATYGWNCFGKESWQNADLGTPAVAGGAVWLEDGSLELTGSGSAAPSTTFSLQHAFLPIQDLNNIAELSAQIELDSSAALAGLYLTFGENGSSSLFTGRFGLDTVRTVSSDGEILEWDVDPAKPVWLKFTWNAEAGTVSLSDDEVTWEELKSVTFGTGGLATAGFAVSSTDGALQSAVFSSIAPSEELLETEEEIEVDTGGIEMDPTGPGTPPVPIPVEQPPAPKNLEKLARKFHPKDLYRGYLMV